jgi:hypothetical protein
MVLRLRKRSAPMHAERQTPEAPSFIVTYVREVVVPLFGENYATEAVRQDDLCLSFLSLFVKLINVSLVDIVKSNA